MPWAALRAGLMVLAGAVLGADVSGLHAVIGLPVLLLTVIAYAPFGLVSAASILIFRTATPPNSAVLALSMLLCCVVLWTAGPIACGLRGSRHAGTLSHY